jgi:hypothetical protein
MTLVAPCATAIALVLACRLRREASTARRRYLPRFVAISVVLLIAAVALRAGHRWPGPTAAWATAQFVACKLLGAIVE